ncbi:hypothetical protein QO002_003270 [Pararhizobium capsulatum DSM 1112]|uniref:Uncharacterized protein n=1 Tax=Pararhizobium capsulatum DSM 1112 TaxID=1121113 RepID=A0ABU0BS94_9HYPH|nr:hypothetical protein [Pararhizobium capsulatum DSM 1112]
MPPWQHEIFKKLPIASISAGMTDDTKDQGPKKQAHVPRRYRFASGGSNAVQIDFWTWQGLLMSPTMEKRPRYRFRAMTPSGRPEADIDGCMIERQLCAFIPVIHTVFARP